MNKNYVFDNIIFLPEDTPFLDSFEKGLINSYSWNIRSYKKSEPIYIRSADGKIFELSNHPDRHYDWLNRVVPVNSSYVHIPNLRFNGVSEDTIDKLQQFYSRNSSIDKKDVTSKDINMQPLQVGHDIEDYFLDL